MTLNWERIEVEWGGDFKSILANSPRADEGGDERSI